MATFSAIYNQWIDAGCPRHNMASDWNTDENIRLLTAWLQSSNESLSIDSGYHFPLELGFNSHFALPSIAVDFKNKRVNVFQSGDCIQPNIIQVRPDESGQVSPAAQALLTELELKVLRFVGLDKPTPAE